MYNRAPVDTYTATVVAGTVVTMVTDRGPTDLTLPDALSIGGIRGVTVNTDRRVAVATQARTRGNDEGRRADTGTALGNAHRTVASDASLASYLSYNESVDVPAVDVSAGTFTPLGN